MEKQKSSVQYAPEVRERMVLEHGGGHASQWERSARSRRRSAVRARRCANGCGRRSGTTVCGLVRRARIKALEREVRELHQANEILRKASAYFAIAALDRRLKP